MSIENTLNTFKAHLSNLAKEPVFIGWPDADKKGVYVYLYSIGDTLQDTFHSPRSSQEKSPPFRKNISLLIFPNPESDHELIDRLILGLNEISIIEVNDKPVQVTPSHLGFEDLNRFFIARKENYRLALAYNITQIEFTPDKETIVPEIQSIVRGL